MKQVSFFERPLQEVFPDRQSADPQSGMELELLADKICSLGMRQGALFILEAHRPFSSVLSHLGQLVEAIIPSCALQKYSSLLTNRENLEKLCTLLEQRD